MSEDRRNIAPEFYEAVKGALETVTKYGDHVSTAKALWTNTLIEVWQGDGAKTIETPHFMGRNVNEIEATIRSMYARS